MHQTDQLGAGKVAMNLSSLGAKATLFGFWGDDAEANSFEQLLLDATVEPHLIKNQWSSYYDQTPHRPRQTGDAETGSGSDGRISKHGILHAQNSDQHRPSDHGCARASDYGKGALAEEICSNTSYQRR